MSTELQKHYCFFEMLSCCFVYADASRIKGGVGGGGREAGEGGRGGVVTHTLCEQVPDQTAHGMVILLLLLLLLLLLFCLLHGGESVSGIGINV